MTTLRSLPYKRIRPRPSKARMHSNTRSEQGQGASGVCDGDSKGLNCSYSSWQFSKRLEWYPHHSQVPFRSCGSEDEWDVLILVCRHRLSNTGGSQYLKGLTRTETGARKYPHPRALGGSTTKCSCVGLGQADSCVACNWCGPW